MVCCDVSDLGTGRLARPAKVDNRSHLVRGESQPSGTANEAKSANMSVVVDAMATLGSLRCGQHAYPLEVTNGLAVHTSFTGQFPASKPTGCGRHVDFP